MDDLPSEFDVIIVGTGLSESILSAAVSRVGHTVLHLDPSEYYGGKWATLSWDQLDSDLLSKGFSAPTTETVTETTTELEQQLNPKEANPNSGTGTGSDSETIASEKNCYFERTNCIRNVERKWYESAGPKTSAGTTNTDTDTDSTPPNDNTNANTTTTNKSSISKLSRKFNIDIYPKVVLAREEIIQLLIDSNVSRYLEFKCISKLFVSLPPPLDTVIEPVPLSRSDIFTSTSLGLVEKRKLTKFIDLILKSETFEAATETETLPTPTPTSTPTPYENIIKSSGITDKIQHLIQTSVRNVEDAFDLPHFTARFVQSFRIFLQSIGRYGNQTPYLWTLYGVGEICQAFCRLSAIYGGIFILKRSVQSASVVHHAKSSENENENENEETSHILVTTDDAKIKAKYLVLGSDVKPKKLLGEGVGKNSEISEETRTVARGVLLTVGGKIKNSTAKNANEKTEKESSMSVYKIGNMEIIEVDSTSLAVPDPYRLVHVTYPCLSSQDENNPRTIIENSLKSFVDFPQTTAETEVNENAKQHEGENSGGAPPRPLVLFGSYFLVDFVDRHTSNESFSNENGLEGKAAQDKNRILYCTTKSTGITGEINKAREIFEEMFPGEEFLPKAPDAEAEAEAREEEGEAELSS